MSTSDLSAFFKILRGYKRPIILIMIVITFSTSAIGIQRTLLSIYISDIDDIFSSYIIVGSSIALISYAISKAIGNLLGGRLSDQQGRKNVIRLGSLVLVIGSLIIAFVQKIFAFFVGNFFLGGGIGLILSAASVYVSDISTSEHRAKAISLIELTVYLGTSFGAITAGFITSGGNLEDPFIYVSILLVLSTFLTLYIVDVSKSIIKDEVSMGSEPSDSKAYLEILREKYSAKTRNSQVFDQVQEKISMPSDSLVDPGVGNLETHTYSPSLMLTYATGIVSRVSDSAIILILPLMLFISDFNSSQIGIIASTFTLFWVVGIGLTGPISDIVGRKLPLVTGLILEFLGILILISPIFNKLFITILLAVIIAGTGRGLYFPIPSSIITDQAPADRRGVLLGKYRFVLDLGYVLGCFLMILIIEPYRNLPTISLFDLFNNVFLVISVLLLIVAILSSQFMRDSRPGFVQIDDIKEHFSLVSQSLTAITESFADYADESFTASNKKYEVAKNFERKADNELSLLIQKTYGESYMVSDAFELVNFSTKLDKALGHALRANKKLSQLSSVPSIQIRLRLLEYVIVLEFMGKVIQEMIDLIEIKITHAAKLSYKINIIENLLDEIHLHLWDELVADSKNLNPLSTILVKELLESLEKSSNTIEDASEIIRLISFKHHF